MRVLNWRVENFGSYKSMEFDPSNRGLTLISGPTGSGKSTLCDVIPWILFGKTAKDGAVDDVRNWSTEEDTKGWAEVEVGQRVLIINRIRGKQNDLYFTNGISQANRGKDIPDTQKMINKYLGLTPDLYLSGAYFHEFSRTANFFATTAKARRELCDQIVDLLLANKLQKSFSEEKKQISKDVDKLNLKTAITTNHLNSLNKALNDHTKLSQTFERDQEKKILGLQERLKEEINNKPVHNHLPGVCPTCGAVVNKAIKPVIAFSHSDSIKSRIDEERSAANPYHTLVKISKKDIASTTLSLEKLTEDQLALALQLNDIELMVDVVSVFRGAVVRQTIVELQNKTNSLLTKHFDAEIKVSLSIDEDALEVAIQKNAVTCNYSQLSKGQRQLLRLCFAISTMRVVQNAHGVHFSEIFLDEFLDGLDETFKLKAFGLLKELEAEYGSVFCVEHNNSLQAMFSNLIQVKLENGHSVVNG